MRMLRRVDLLRGKNILENAEASKIILLPPQNPKDESVYVLKQNSRNDMDYVADVFSWKNFSSHKLPQKEPIIRVRYYHRKVKNELVEFKKYCMYMNLSTTFRSGF